ncbi:MAG: hypothetical protein AMXMBFR33_01400 [Candidatus Xenobia bacterium]
MAGTITPYLTDDWADDDVSPQGGDPDLGSPLDEDTEGAFIPDIPTPDEPPDLGPWHYKLGAVNTGDATLSNLRFWVANGLNKPAAQGTWQIQADGPCTDWVRVSYKLGGEWTTELKQCNGTTAVSGENQMDEESPVLMECCNEAGTALQNASRNIRLIRGDQLGYIPIGKTGATSEHRLGLDPAVDSNLGTTDRLTPPTGVTFSGAFSLATALTVPGGGDLAVNEAIGLWFETTGYAELPERIAYMKPVVKWKASS